MRSSNPKPNNSREPGMLGTGVIARMNSPQSANSKCKIRVELAEWTFCLHSLSKRTTLKVNSFIRQ